MAETTRKKKVEVEPRPLWARFLFQLALKLTKIPATLRYEGQNKLPKNGAFVLAANHQSYLDGLWIMGGLSRDQFQKATALAGADLAKDHGLMGKVLMKIARPIPLARYGNPVRGLIRAKRALTQGNIVLIHPEGTRTHDGFLGPCLSGAGYLSLKAKVPIIPVYISGAYDFFSRHQKFPCLKVKRTKRRPLIRVRYLDPLLPQDYRDAHSLKDALEQALLEAETKWLEGPEGRQASRVSPELDWTQKGL